MNIEGLSEGTLEKLIGWVVLHDRLDIYKLDKHRDEILMMDGFGEKSYQNLWEAIHFSNPKAKCIDKEPITRRLLTAVIGSYCFNDLLDLPAVDKKKPLGHMILHTHFTVLTYSDFRGISVFFPVIGLPLSLKPI